LIAIQKKSTGRKNAMSETAYRRNNCRLCGGRELELVLKLAPTPLADAYVPVARANEPQPCYPLDLFLCRTCGFSQLLDVVQPQAIYTDYIYETVSSLGLVDHFQRYAEDVVQRIKPDKGSLVIDIGSNDGTLLKSFRNLGMKVLGIDPAREIARRATAAGVETLPEFLAGKVAEQLKKERGPAAIVTANNVIANVDDLDEVAVAIRKLLAPDGVFVFESFYLGDLIRNMVFDFIYHEHISCFSVKPVELFFRRHGMELIDVQRIPTKGGSLRYTIQLGGGPRRVSSIVGELKTNEAKEGLDRPETFKAFAAKIEAARQSVLTLLRRLESEGNKIVGYGASATTTTLIYHFELGNFIDYIVDDYPAKQNLFSPGLHIPVLAPEVIYQRKPDYVVIFAWRYFEPIVKKNQKYVNDGGHFVVPMPELSVI
jgi:SAM-dependent methyltransferase